MPFFTIFALIVTPAFAEEDEEIVDAMSLDYTASIFTSCEAERLEYTGKSPRMIEATAKANAISAADQRGCILAKADALSKTRVSIATAGAIKEGKDINTELEPGAKIKTKAGAAARPHHLGFGGHAHAGHGLTVTERAQTAEAFLQSGRKIVPQTPVVVETPPVKVIDPELERKRRVVAAIAEAEAERRWLERNQSPAE